MSSTQINWYNSPLIHLSFLPPNLETYIKIFPSLTICLMFPHICLPSTAVFLLHSEVYQHLTSLLHYHFALCHLHLQFPSLTQPPKFNAISKYRSVSTLSESIVVKFLAMTDSFPIFFNHIYHLFPNSSFHLPHYVSHEDVNLTSQVHSSIPTFLNMYPSSLLTHKHVLFFFLV